MPLIRCPRCAQRQLVTDQVIGDTVGCSRCDRTFVAEPLTTASHFREVTYFAGAILIGAIVSWMLVRPN